MAKTDATLRIAINDAKYVTADGLPIVWLCRRAHKSGVTRVTGIDLAEACLQRASREKWRVFVLGGREQIARQAIANLQRTYSGIEVVGYQHGFYTSEEIPTIVSTIRQCRPDILFLALGLPQKEHFLHNNFHQLDFGFCITVGGALDIWANAKRRAPKIVQKLGLEWLYRSASNLRKSLDLIVHGGRFVHDLLFYGHALEARSE